MKFVKIKIGIKETYAEKYLNGACVVRGLNIEGDTPEIIAEAEALRYEVLQAYAVRLYDCYGRNK